MNSHLCVICVSHFEFTLPNLIEMGMFLCDKAVNCGYLFRVGKDERSSHPAMRTHVLPTTLSAPTQQSHDSILHPLSFGISRGRSATQLHNFGTNLSACLASGTESDAKTEG